MRHYVQFFIVFISALSFVFLVPQSFIHSESILHILQKTTDLKVHPDYTGGTELARFYDPEGDDYGNGNLIYPRTEEWSQDGVLDLIRYTVHEPVTKAIWFELPSYWQLDLSFSSLLNPMQGQLGFSFPVIHIYIDIDGRQSGSIQSYETAAEKVRFSENHPWDYMVHIDGFSRSGKIVAADSDYESNVPVIIEHHTNTLKVRIPLEDEGLLNILNSPATAHYVLIGAYDQLGTGKFMSVTRRGSTHTGGGADSPYMPKVYDYLAPHGKNQKSLLGSYDGRARMYARLEPVIADPSVQKKTISEEELKELEALAETERLETKQNENSSVSLPISQPEDMPDQEWMIALFLAERNNEAFSLAEKILTAEPDNSVVTAYYASLIAKKGGASDNVAESIRLVNQAFLLFEKAEENLSDVDALLDLYFNRGYVCMSIPEMVFHKGEQGGKDFMNAARILTETNADPVRIASAYILAGQSFEQAIKQFQAETAYQKALSVDGINAQQRLELAKRGYF